MVSVARHCHFGKAARECHVSQSALSLQVQKLEREFGVQIFERTNRRVIVTETGQELVLKAVEILRGRQEMLETIQTSGEELTGNIRIGAIPTIAPYLFTEVGGGLQKHYPGIIPLFEEEVTQRLLASVVAGEIELGIIATTPEDTLLETVDLFEEPFFLAVPRGHELVNKKVVGTEDLGGGQMLILKDTHCLREQVLGFCHSHNVDSNRRSAATNIATLLVLVQLEGGISMVPAMATGRENQHPDVRFLPMDPTPTRKVRLVYRRTSRIGQRISQAVKKCISPRPH